MVAADSLVIIEHSSNVFSNELSAKYNKAQKITTKIAI